MGDDSGHLLPPESSNLAPLPPVLHDGLMAVTVIASFSLLTSTALFAHLTYKIIKWQKKKAARSKARKVASQETSSHGRQYFEPPSPGFDLALGLAERHFHAEADAATRRARGASATAKTEPAAGHGWRSSLKGRLSKGIWPSNAAQTGSAATQQQKEPELNQFLVLLYNLLLADMHQALAFVLNAVWIGENALMAGSATCWAQGIFVSNGDLAASLFITTIAIHTYCSVSMDYKPPQWVIKATCIGIWVFTYSMVIIGLGVTRNGADAGGFYVRASAWCWVNQKYKTIRLFTHYAYIFFTLALTSLLYTLVFFSLRRRQQRQQRQQRQHQQQLKIAQDQQSQSTELSPMQSKKTSIDFRHATVSVTSTAPVASEEEDAIDIENQAAGRHRSGSGTSDSTSADNSGSSSDYTRHPGFLIYPVIYVICTLPLALGRIASSAGAEVPLSYFCAAGALITSNGWLDVLIWSTTRRDIVFGDVDSEDVGISTFAFIRTPPTRRFGNIVWVEGGVNNRDRKQQGGEDGHRSSHTLGKHSQSSSTSHSNRSSRSQSMSQDNQVTGGTSRGGVQPFDDADSAGWRGIRDRLAAKMLQPHGFGLRALTSRAIGARTAHSGGVGSTSQESLQRLNSGPEQLQGRQQHSRGLGSRGHRDSAGTNSGSLAIHMDLETSVVVEIEEAPPESMRPQPRTTKLPAYDEKDMPDLPPIV